MKSGENHKMDDYNADKPKTIRTPYGDITLLPITPEDMEMVKRSLLSSLSSSSEDDHMEGCAER